MKNEEKHEDGTWEKEELGHKDIDDMAEDVYEKSSLLVKMQYWETVLC